MSHYRFSLPIILSLATCSDLHHILLILKQFWRKITPKYWTAAITLGRTLGSIRNCSWRSSSGEKRCSSNYQFKIRFVNGKISGHTNQSSSFFIKSIAMNKKVLDIFHLFQTKTFWEQT